MKKIITNLLLTAIFPLFIIGCDKDNDNNYISPNDEGSSSSITAPSGLRAIIDEDNDIYLTWNSVPNAVKYYVYHSTTSSGNYSYVGYTTNTYAYIRNPETGYHYMKVSAENSSGTESSMSSSVSCYISGNNGGGNNGGGNNGGGNNGGGNNGGGSSVSRPDAPTGVSVANEGPVTYPSVFVRWNEVSGATSYKVYRSASANGSYSLIGSTDYHVYHDEDAPTNGRSAYYKVKAVNSAGESDYSSYALYQSVSPADVLSPCPPTITISGTTSHTISWSNSSSSECGRPTSYEVHQYDPCEGEYVYKTTTTSTSYRCTDVFPGINAYAVRAINSNGSAYNIQTSSEVPLAKPSSFTATKQGSYVYFTWSAVSKATEYQIFVSSTVSGTYSWLATVSDGSETDTLVYYPATSGTTMFFKIKALFTCDNRYVQSDLTSYKSVRF